MSGPRRKNEFDALKFYLDLYKEVIYFLARLLFALVSSLFTCNQKNWGKWRISFSINPIPVGVGGIKFRRILNSKNVYFLNMAPV